MSHPSLVRENGVAPTPAPGAEPLSEGDLVVGDWCYLFSGDGVQQNATPYRITAIAQGPDGDWYAQFRETSTSWRLDQCEKAEPLTPGEAFDALYEGMLEGQEEAQMRTLFPPPVSGMPHAPERTSETPAPGLPLNEAPLVQACPQCGCTELMDCVTYKKCPLCPWKDGPTPQEILEQREA